ncbi:MAG: hypothetical protein H6622_01550 [Halobacteriovoraceae bacterium]|nr:hypothetical protein [Halobacteriovoraceae bacterium]
MPINFLKMFFIIIFSSSCFSADIIHIDFKTKNQNSSLRNRKIPSAGEVETQLTSVLQALKGHYFFDYEIPDKLKIYGRYKSTWLLKFNPRNFEVYQSVKVSSLAKQVYEEIHKLIEILENEFVFINGKLDYFHNHPLLQEIKQFSKYKINHYWSSLLIRKESFFQSKFSVVFDYLKSNGLETVYSYLKQKNYFESYFRLFLQLDNVTYFRAIHRHLDYKDLGQRYMDFLKREIQYLYSNEHLLGIVQSEDVKKLLYHFKKTVELISYDDTHIEFLYIQKNIANQHLFGTHPWSIYIDDIVTEIFYEHPEFNNNIQSDSLRNKIKNSKILLLPKRICQLLLQKVKR